MACLRQSDVRWGELLLGDGPSRIKRGGCLLCAITEALRRLTSRTDILPPHVNETLRQAGAFIGSAMVIHEAARVLGLEAPREELVTSDGDLADALERALAGGCAIVHVNKDADPEGDHFLLAVGFARPPGGPLHVECTDSATGVPVWLSWPDLTATVRWDEKVMKKYKAVSVRPVRRAGSGT